MNSFIFVKKNWKNCFLALVGITKVKGTSVTKSDAKKDVFPILIWIHFWLIFHQKVDQKTDAKIDVEKKNNCKRLPKWSRNRWQHASKINAKTDIEKDHGNHQIMFLWKVKTLKFIWKTLVFDHQKSDPKWKPKSIKNLSQIDAKKETKNEGLKH